MAGFEDILVEKGLLSEAQLGAARERARANRESLVAALVGGKFVDEAALLPVVAERQRMRFVRLSEETVIPPAERNAPVLSDDLKRGCQRGGLAHFVKTRRDGFRD